MGKASLLSVAAPHTPGWLACEHPVVLPGWGGCPGAPIHSEEKGRKGEGLEKEEKNRKGSPILRGTDWSKSMNG